MTSARPGIFQSLVAATLAACGGADARHTPTAVVTTPKPSAPQSTRSSPVTTETSSAAVPSHARIFRPADAGVDLSFGRFGHPCDLANDPSTRVVMVQCDRVGAPDESGITVNFYLPGIWDSQLLTAERVATMIRDNAGTNSHVEGAFGVRDPVTAQLVYFLTISAVYAVTGQGQAYIIKVAALEDAVYSVSYTTMFSGKPEVMRDRIREWLAVHVTEYGQELGGLTLDPSWVAYLHSQLHGAKRTP